MFGEWMRVLCLHNGGLGSDTLQARFCLSNFRNNSDQLCLQNPHFIAQIFRIMAVDHADINTGRLLDKTLWDSRPLHRRPQQSEEAKTIHRYVT